MRVLIGLIIVVLLLGSWAGAEEEEEYIDAWVMCNPKSEVNVRISPKKKAESIAKVYPGQHIWLTGKKQGRWYQCSVPCEAGEGWIRGDYLSFYEPKIYEEGKTYVTTCSKLIVRYSIKGNKCGELSKGRRVTVYLIAEEWAVTSKGFIMSQYLEELPDG